MDFVSEFVIFSFLLTRNHTDACLFLSSAVAVDCVGLRGPSRLHMESTDEGDCTKTTGPLRSDCFCVHHVKVHLLRCFPYNIYNQTDLESHGINLGWESRNWSCKNNVYRPSCTTAVFLMIEIENTHSTHVTIK